jgi:predicted amidohydrolase
MQDLILALIQTDVHWHEIEANLAHFEEKIWEVPEETDLILLPEMFNTGFTMDARGVAEPMNFKTMRWMQRMAALKQSVLCGSLISKENGKYFNRLLWFRPDGTFETYDKNHLFRFAGEHEVFSPGHQRLQTRIDNWNFMPQVCYDLRFPIWNRNEYSESSGFIYEVLIFVANWPAARAAAWDSLLRARAIENSCYCIGLNRIGLDGNRIQYSGQSVAYDPKGQPLLFLDDNDVVSMLKLSWDDLFQYRNKFRVHLDWDQRPD